MIPEEAQDDGELLGSQNINIDTQQKEEKLDPIFENYRVPFLPINPDSGFPAVDKYEDWDEFDNAYKDLILTRFRQDTDNRQGVITDLNRFISRFYRLSGKVDQMESGKQNQHILDMDFNEEAPPKEYLFHRLHEFRKQIGNNDQTDPKEEQLVAGGKLRGQALQNAAEAYWEGMNAESSSALKQRKKSHQPQGNAGLAKAATRGKIIEKGGHTSSHSSLETAGQGQEGSRLTRHSNTNLVKKLPIDQFKKKLTRKFKNADFTKTYQSSERQNTLPATTTNKVEKLQQQQPPSK